MAYVKFYTEPVENEARSAETGKIEFDEVEMIHIIVDDKNEIIRPVEDKDREKYRPIYDAWKEGKEPPMEGTPLSEWPGVSRSQVEILNRVHIKTVEDFAQSPDTTLGRLGPGMMTLREKARAWLKAAEDVGEVTARVVQLEQENAQKDETIEELKSQVSELFGRLAALEPKAAASKASSKKAPTKPVAERDK